MIFSEWATITHTIEMAIGKEFEPDRVKIYFELLKDLSNDDVQKAVYKLLQERVYSNIPMAAEIREIVVRLPALQAWKKYVDGIDKQRFSGFGIETYFSCGEKTRVDGFKTFVSKLEPDIQPFAENLGREFATQVSSQEDHTWLKREFLEQWDIPRNREPERLPDSEPVSKLVGDLAAKLRIAK